MSGYKMTVHPAGRFWGWAMVVMAVCACAATTTRLTLGYKDGLSDDFLGLSSFIMEVLFLVGLSVFFFWLSLIVYRIPRKESPVEAKGIQKVALFALLLAALFIDAFALRLLSYLQAGQYEFYYGVLIVCIIVSLFGVILSLAFPILFLKKLREPNLRLIFVTPDPVVGEISEDKSSFQWTLEKRQRLSPHLKCFVTNLTRLSSVAHHMLFGRKKFSSSSSSLWALDIVEEPSRYSSIASL